MADNQKISELTQGTPLDTDVIPYVDGVAGETKKALKSELKGDTGDAATATAGTTTTLIPGADATVVNSGTTSAAIFDFGIPEGEQGIQGIQGNPGADGADGVVQAVVGGTNVTVDATDPTNPIVNVAGGGDMTKAVYDPTTVAGDAFAMDNMVEGTTTKILTATERSEIAANTLKATNATHTGEVTGSGALTVADNIIDEANLKLDTGPTNDYILTADSTKTGGMKWAEASGGGLSYNQELDSSFTVLGLSVDNYKIGAAIYDGVSADVSGEDLSPNGVFFKSDGTKMYMVGDANDTVFQYSLPTPWVLTGAIYDSVSFSTSGQDASPRDLFFKTDGTKMYIMGGVNDTVYQYSLPTPWVLTGASYDSVSFSVTSQDSVPRGFSFKTDGTKMYMVGDTNNGVYQYSLPTPWVLTGASYDSVSLSVTSQDTTPRGASFKSDGTKMYLLGGANESIFQYSLPTPWVLTGASYDSVSFSTNNEDTETTGLYIKADGTKMYTVGQSNDNAYQYSIGTVSPYHYISFPTSFDTKTISAIGVNVYDAGTSGSGTTDFDIESRTIAGSTAGTWTSIFSTTLTLDVGEYDTRDAATPAVISSGTIANKNQYRLVVNGLSATDICGLGIWMDIA